MATDAEMLRTLAHQHTGPMDVVLERAARRAELVSKVRKVQLMHAGGGQYYWHAKGGNGAIIFDGGERLTHKKRLVDFLQSEWPHAPIEVLDAGAVVQTIPALQPN